MSIRERAAVDRADAVTDASIRTGRAFPGGHVWGVATSAYCEWARGYAKRFGLHAVETGDRSPGKRATAGLTPEVRPARTTW